jgi:peptidylprolyl isomerase
VRILPRLLASLLALTVGGTATRALADPTPAPSASAAPAAEKTITTATGLQYVDVEIGSGPTPKPGQTVAIAYTISFDGKKIANSRSGQPFAFALDRDQAMKGLDQGVSTMKVGGKRKLLVPPSLGYGAEGVEGRVPPNATLQIDVELLEIRK